MFKAYQIQVDSALKEMLQHANILDCAPPQTTRRAKLGKMINAVSLSGHNLDAESIWDEWFPTVEADIFISHSSIDAALARAFSAWLRDKHQLTSFIDSDIWGYSEDLLRIIDNKFCRNSDKDSYSYVKRNASTAHVYMMLTYALTQMINKTECFMFLCSHNSAKAQDSIGRTYSPWIFHELATVDTIETTSPYTVKQEKKSRVLLENFTQKVEYPILGRRLKLINSMALKKWCRRKRISSSHSLDLLYELTN